MKLVVLIFALLCLWAKCAMAEMGSTATPPFAWDHSGSTNSLARYEIHYGPLGRTTNDPFYARNYTATSNVPKFASGHTLFGIHPGIWFMSVTAVGTNGIASLYSNEVCYTNRGEAPVNLRIVGPTEYIAIESSFAPGEPPHEVIKYTNTPIQRALAAREFLKARRVAPPPPLPGGAP